MWESLMSEPLVGIIMGSSSDWETMRHAAETLDKLGIPHETKIVSAHRTPKRLDGYAAAAKGRGLKLIIAGAGGAAHLPGMTASMTSLPVLGVPVETAALKGMDSLLSIVQMPAGVPVGTLAIGAAGLGYACHIYAPEAEPPAARVAARATRADYVDLAALRAFADTVDVATYEFENLPAEALAELGDKLRPGTASLAIAQDRAVEKRFMETKGGTVARWLSVGSEADADSAERALGLPLVLKSR